MPIERHNRVSNQTSILIIRIVLLSMPMNLQKLKLIHSSFYRGIGLLIGLLIISEPFILAFHPHSFTLQTDCNQSLESTHQNKTIKIDEPVPHTHNFDEETDNSHYHEALKNKLHRLIKIFSSIFLPLCLLFLPLPKIKECISSLIYGNLLFPPKSVPLHHQKILLLL